MKSVKLYGELATEFGENFNFDVSSVGQSLRLLEANFPGHFTKKLTNGSYHVFVTRKGDESRVFDVGHNVELAARMNLGHDSIIHIMPVAEGAKNGKGFLTIILGIVLIATGFALATPFLASAAAVTGMATPLLGGLITSGTLVGMGIALTLGGIATLLTPVPNVDSSFGDEDQKQSFLFNGAVNTLEQGGPVPVIYGEVYCGSTVISAGLTVERLELAEYVDDGSTPEGKFLYPSSNTPSNVFRSRFVPLTEAKSGNVTAAAPVKASPFNPPYSVVYSFTGSPEYGDGLEVIYAGQYFKVQANHEHSGGTLGVASLAEQLRAIISGHPQITATGSSSGPTQYSITVTSSYTSLGNSTTPRTV